ncbi:MAG: MBL fold metallo-hydrolase [Clostridium sp.]|nr:MBL fold metallo-hydrolase [Clostridium sp.]
MNMKILHIYHSGFYMELSQCALLFDYYKGTLPPIPFEKPLFVFASHVHQDHFSFSVFTKEELRAHPQAAYLLSNDIKRKYNRNFFLRQGVTETQYERITFLKAGEELCLSIDGSKEGAGGIQKEDCRGPCGKEPDAEGETGSGIRVRTLRSTDAGVAFLVDAGGRHIYHAGDLNWWSWEGETEEDGRAMERAYKAEIEKISGQAFDVACLPLDSRQGERFACGFDWFMRHVEVRHAYPMHYWDDDTVIEKLLALPCSEPYRNRVVKERRID